MPPSLLFDLDGTLIDSRLDLAAAVNHVRLSNHKPEIPVEAVVPHIGNGMDNLLQKTVGDTHGRDIFIEFYGGHCVDQTRLYNGVADGLNDLSKKFKLGIVTNKPQGFSLKILDQLKILGYFSVVVGGDSLPQKKPDPAPLLAALEKLGGEPPISWMIGDGWQDVEAGKKAGLKTCAAEYGFGFTEKTRALDPDRLVKQFDELKEIVK